MAGAPLMTGIAVTTYNLNANSGAYTTLYGKILSRIIEILEDGSANGGTAQGLQYLLPDPQNAGAWVGPFVIEPQTEPIRLGDPYAAFGPYGSAVAKGSDFLVGVGVTGGTPYIQIRSASATETVVRVTEFN